MMPSPNIPVFSSKLTAKDSQKIHMPKGVLIRLPTPRRVGAVWRGMVHNMTVRSTQLLPKLLSTENI